MSALREQQLPYFARSLRGRLFSFLIYFYRYVTVANALFGGKKKRDARLAAEKAAMEAARMSNLVVIFGKEFDKTSFYTIISTSVVLSLAVCFHVGSRSRLKERYKADTTRETLPKKKALDVIIVGCGLPKKGMGWYHLMQLLQMSNVNIRAVVEPFYLDETLCCQPPSSFIDLVTTLQEMGIPCVRQVRQLEKRKRRTLCLIAGRTHDNPRFFEECIELGATDIYLEVPGAPEVKQLRDMKLQANKRGVRVFMGYQKLTSTYVESAVALSRKIPNSHVFFCTNEPYQKKLVDQVFVRYPEGMLKSLVCQELAILVVHFRVAANTIEKFKVNSSPLFSEKKRFRSNSLCDTIRTDFLRAAFKITTIEGQTVSVMADRCGGLTSFAVVKNHRGAEVKRFESPDEEGTERFEHLMLEDSEMMHYFFLQSDEYMELKKRVVQTILDNSPAGGLTSIENGIDVLMLADYCTKELNTLLKA